MTAAGTAGVTTVMTVDDRDDRRVTTTDRDEPLAAMTAGVTTGTGATFRRSATAPTSVTARATNSPGATGSATDATTTAGVARRLPGIGADYGYRSGYEEGWRDAAHYYGAGYRPRYWA